MKYVVNGAKKGAKLYKLDKYLQTFFKGWREMHSTKRVITSEWGNGDLLFSSFLFFHILYNESVFAFITM